QAPGFIQNPFAGASMGYGIMPICVDLQTVKAAIGSKNDRLLGALAAKFAEDLQRLDDNDDLNEDEVPVTAATVLHQMIMGEEYSRSSWFAFKYGYVLKFMCEHFGQSLPNGQWTAMRWEWADTVDSALAEAGISEDRFRVVAHLMTRGAPITIPRPED